MSGALRPDLRYKPVFVSLIMLSLRVVSQVLWWLTAKRLGYGVTEKNPVGVASPHLSVARDLHCLRCEASTVRSTYPSASTGHKVQFIEHYERSLSDHRRVGVRGGLR